MTRIAIFSAMGLALALSAGAVAAPPEGGVDFSATALMPSILDPAKPDSFNVVITDAKVSTNLSLKCQAADTKLLFVRQDKQCGVGGTGSVISPSGQQIPRAQYQGQYTVQKDGTTEASSLIVNYLAVGKVAPYTAAFSGALGLKPELTSSGASALRDAVLKGIGARSEGVVTEAVDTIDLSNLCIPSSGLPNDKGTCWSGNGVYSYQTSSWFWDVKASFDGREFPLKGNMPMLGDITVDGTSTYQLTLTLPATELQGDDALFASTDSNTDLFSTVDGITGTITMANSRIVDVTIDGETFKTPSIVDANGTIVGNGVPLEITRSWATLMGLLIGTLVGP